MREINAMSTNLFTRPLDQITIDDVNAFLDLNLEEGIRLDYKEAEKNMAGPPSSMIETIVAFANTQGGILILGVKADKVTNRPIAREGLTFLKKTSLEEAITSRCYNAIIPPISPEIGIYTFKPDPTQPADDRAFVVIRVQSGGTAIYSTSDNRVLIRVGSECQNADLMTLRFLFEREQKQMKLVSQRSNELLEGYWMLRQQFMSELIEKTKRWTSSPTRLYLEYVPLDATIDILPFGSLALDANISEEISNTPWYVLESIVRPEGLGLLVDFAHSRTGSYSDKGKDSPVSFFTRKGRVAKMRFHDLRHTMATILLESNVHPKKIQERLGHSSILITMDTYSYVLPSMHQGVARKLDDLF